MHSRLFVHENLVQTGESKWSLRNTSISKVFIVLKIKALYYNDITAPSTAFEYDTPGDSRLRFCTYGPLNSLCIQMKFENGFDFQNFHHVCLVNSVTVRQRRSKLYYDGKHQADSKRNSIWSLICVLVPYTLRSIRKWTE